MSYIKIIGRKSGVVVFHAKTTCKRCRKSYGSSKKKDENLYFFVTKWGASRLHLDS
jgi:hypothetical protein